MSETDLKKCSLCEQMLPKSTKYFSPSHGGYLRSRCRSCRAYTYHQKKGELEDVCPVGWRARLGTKCEVCPRPATSVVLRTRRIVCRSHAVLVGLLQARPGLAARIRALRAPTEVVPYPLESYPEARVLVRGNYKGLHEDYLVGLLVAQGWMCGLCDERLASASGAIDRIHPGAAGGRYVPGNVMWVCRACNVHKRDCTREIADWYLAAGGM